MSIETKPVLLLVGAGKMGGALLRGWLGAGLSPDRLFVKEPHPSSELSSLLVRHGIADHPPSPPDVMVLAVKPQILDQVLREVAPLAGAGTLVLSVAAGRTVTGIAAHFAPGTAIVRSMPNLPAEVARGITALYANAFVTQDQKALCESLLRAVGEVAWVDDESLMDAVTAVSGSGPAYVFHLVECLAEAGRAQGLAPELAMQFARATVIGAGELLRLSPLAPAQLRENVTSPNGTTAAGLSVLMGESGLADLMTRTVAAAARRSRELSS